MSKYYLFPQATTHIPAVWAGFEIIVSFYFIGHPFALLRPSISGLMKKVGKFVGKQRDSAMYSYTELGFLKNGYKHKEDAFK